MEKMPDRKNSQEHIKNLDLIKTVSVAMSELHERFVMKKPDSGLNISGALFVQNYTTLELSFEGVYDSLSELQEDIESKIKGLSEDSYVVEALQLEGFEQDSDGKEIMDTSFFKRLI